MTIPLGADERSEADFGYAPLPEPSSAHVLNHSLGRASDPAKLLASLYQDTQVGQQISVIEPVVRTGPLRKVRSLLDRNQGAGIFTPDSLSILLYQQGFVDTRVEVQGDTLTATASRGVALPPSDRPLRLTVVMPVYNERETFRKVFLELLDKSIEDTEIDVIVVESNSTDGTREDVVALSNHPRVTALFEDSAQGKGHAVRMGLREASGDVILIQDADDEYDMDDYEKLIQPVRTFESSFILGCRDSHQEHWGMRHFERQHHMSWIMNVGHILFLTLFNVVYGQRLRDPFTMYKVFRRDCITDVNFECNRFDFDWELTAKLIRRGHIPREIPVHYHSRSFSEGKKVTLVGDPISWIRACFKYRFGSIYVNSMSPSKPSP
jgi:Glycosyl transferase family 2